MKSLRKFATLAVGAMMAASAVAAVNVDKTGLESYPFFNNGEPAVKVVIGSTAHPSDVVVAANIAAMIGNLAYTDKDVSVDKTGVSCGAASGTCAIDAGTKKVSLSVTVPGASPANVYTMRTYINDFLDNNSETYRGNTNGYVYTGNSEGYEKALKVTKDKSNVVSLVNEGKVTNPQNLDVKQEQNIYIGSETKYSDTASYKQVVAKGLRAAYSLSFSEPLPVCWDTSKNILTCPDSQDRLNQSHTKINLLGQEWVVISYSMKTGDSTNIGTVELGKETGYNQMMNQDDEIVAANNAKVKLRSISSPTSGSAAASFEVTTAAGVVSYETIVSGNSRDVAGVTIRVNTVFAGTNSVNYADVSVYSDKLSLTDGTQIDSTTHSSWYAAIKSTNSTSSQAISNITLYSTYSTSSDLKAGEKMSLIKGQNAFDVTFEGLDDASITYDNLRFTLMNETLQYNNTHKWTGAYVQVESGVSNAFQTSTTSKNMVRIATNPMIGDTGLGNASIGAAFIQGSDGFWDPITGDYTAPGTTAVTYHYSGSEQSTIGIAAEAVTDSPYSYVWVKEFTEDNSATPKYISLLFEPSLGTAGQFSDSTAASTVSSKIGYNATAPSTADFNGTAVRQYESGFVSDRGTKFVSVGSTYAEFQYPKTVVKAKYTLKTSGTNATSGSVTLDLGEGESKLIDTGYMATVSSITATASGAAGTGGLTGLDTVVADPAKAATVTQLNTNDKPLVLLDADAGSASAVIVVGGPIVNTLAKAAGMSDSPNEEAKVLVQNGKIYVYGYKGADTTAAGNELIKWLAENRDLVRK
ncbi:MAG: S-layer protein [Candidatus Micrarchaeia archaeon]|jgi:hypothetical protein